MDWKTHAARLADEVVVRAESRWYRPLAATPRHLFVPRWWERTTSGDTHVWQLRNGPHDADNTDGTDAWLRSVYADTTLVTRVGPHHADHAQEGRTLTRGRDLRPASSSTLPSLMTTMYRHAFLTDDTRVLITCGTGYGTALACARLGDQQVTSVDVDPYLVQAARERLASIGYHPRTEVRDLTGDLPEGAYDRIIATVSVRPVPVSWLTALAPGGRLVTTLAGTGLIVVADKTEDGGAVGRVAPDAASFMTARHGDDYVDTFPENAEVWETAQHAEGESITTSRYPLTYVPDTWDLRSTLEILVPGIDHRREEGPDGKRTVYMLHADGSWARATATGVYDSPTVHQGGPRRLWDELDRVRSWLAIDGDLPVRGARVRIRPDGTVRLERSGWSATIE
ncbi:methyltransferase domain-containing protein [Streptomyces daliensis]|uniref:Protein-L-isoaspartate O-methyltransferase n=1 Tax=Streptomyces daliensis TaxID=299421 RepID=A0A8T4IM65_9ACTN|nr:50S ribosomal protein L11 methyltransferase [Streptomyces daliensis]